MISDVMKEYLLSDEPTLVKPEEEVAVVNSWHTLEHAILILTADQYSTVPVLDRNSKVLGLISMPKIIKAIMGNEAIDFNRLSEITVGDIIDGEEFPYVYDDFDLEDILQKLVRTAFLTVIDREGAFKGIITRSEMLKGTNRIVHMLESDYELIKKEK